VAKRIPEEELTAIESAVAAHPDGAIARQIEEVLKLSLPPRTLQYRLQHLVAAGRLVKEGERRWAKYRLPPEQPNRVIAGDAKIDAQGDLFVPISKAGAAIQKYIRQRVERRKPTGYDRKFLNAYRAQCDDVSVVERARTPTSSRQSADVGAAGGHICQADLQSPSHRPVVELKPT
jgi:hypothetical protein